MSTQKGTLINKYTPNYVIFDLETTGISPNYDEVIEISALKVKGGEVVDEFNTLVNPGRKIPFGATKVNGITNAMVAEAPAFSHVLAEFLDFAEGLVLVGQPFEAHFFEASAPVCGTGFAGAPGASVPIGEFYYKTDEGVKKCTYNPDKDNIIPICDEEYFSDDIVSRFCELVKIVYGEKSLETNLDFIAKALGNKGNTSREVIRNYFLNDFFKDHCNTYSVTGSGKRPIYWLFDSGKQNGFKALIYMHRYDADTVGRVRTDYLHKAQKYVETAMQSAQYTIDNATSASEKSKATKAVTKYTKQLAEMKIYDEAIAHVANQRIEIDLDDGVKVNYAKFQGVEVAQEGKKALKVDLLAKI